MPRPIFASSSTSHHNSYGRSSQIIYSEHENDQRTGLAIKAKLPGPFKENNSHDSRPQERLESQRSLLCLFKLDMPANGTLEAQVELREGNVQNPADFGLYVVYKSPGMELPNYQYIKNLDLSGDSQTMVFSVSHEVLDSRLVELGAYYTGHIDATESPTLYHILSIVIMRKSAKTKNLENWRINRVKIVERICGEHHQKRIAWEWESTGQPGDADDGVPWSKITGPFASFDVHIRGRHVGRAHCLEFPLLEDDLVGVQEDEDLDIIVYGNLFGGDIVSSGPTSVPREWHFV